MENSKIDKELMWRRYENKRRRGKIAGGLVLVSAGALFMARELGADIPHWVFTWKTLLIAIGLIMAIKHKFRHPGWIILVSIGGLFMLNDFYPEMNIRPFIIPAILIMAGLAIIFVPRRKRYCGGGRWKRHDWQGYQPPGYSSESGTLRPSREDYIESVAIFSSVKKNILSKKFKGGEVINIFGGTELNLMQADLDGPASIEITQVFGGTQLIIPANWELKSEQFVTLLGGIEDRRPAQPNGGDPGKILVITGTTIFGGIEIKSF